MSKKKFVIEATMCETIKSVPLNKEQVQVMAKETKKKLPHAKVKIHKA